ncbi:MULTISPECIES: TetR/AcrR family transcriptional regulator [unclassified Variovorax]|uniref:TetR/AcrR family transcriptional regulator n=1 Tax=unclassified Variovorax TaxID=663243 RepID=UPI001BD67C77|nr:MULTISPECIES: TetR/AcrR family transcriptional regulator [unclassified Variovorax]
MRTEPTPPPVRDSYRHGDLRRALLEAGIELARGGGPEAVVLREATRRAGVVPNAAYRHFASRLELLREVRAAALSAVAAAMEKELAAVPAKGRATDLARAGLRAVGTGYLRFARVQTGLFRTAFFGQPELLEPLNAGPGAVGPGGLNPFQLLGAALDRMVAAGAMPAARRQGAEFLAWAGVHGLALLMIEGPLRGVPEKHAEALGQQLLDMIEKGL